MESQIAVDEIKVVKETIILLNEWKKSYKYKYDMLNERFLLHESLRAIEILCRKCEEYAVWCHMVREIAETIHGPAYEEAKCASVMYREDAEFPDKQHKRY